MPLANIGFEKFGTTPGGTRTKTGEPVVSLTTGLAFHTEGAATRPRCGHETKLNLNTLEKLLPNVSTVV